MIEGNIIIDNAFIGKSKFSEELSVLRQPNGVWYWLRLTKKQFEKFADIGLPVKHSIMNDENFYLVEVYIYYINSRTGFIAHEVTDEIEKLFLNKDNITISFKLFSITYKEHTFKRLYFNPYEIRA